ncbi:reductase [Rhodococcus rhodnii LMG 5362]|uniref:Reductase n=2 Tax=Rhodococcus rhodnii TaxID=38312 RepID=R7WQY3_9NOCA|nr:reductase [Rhodococcus rhodnii LMG 5362]
MGNMTSDDTRFDSAGSAIPTIVLSDGRQIPQLGFGVYKVEPDEAQRVVEEALTVGYRSIDTATLYGNEDGVGRALANSGLRRNEVFVTTKLWNDDQGYDETLRAFDASMNRLGLDHLDLYLVHWPVPSLGRYVDSFRALQKLRDDGRVKSIGVSNFTEEAIERLIAETGEVPALNQIELHPGFTQTELRAYHMGRGIATEAWAPLGQGSVLGDPTIEAIARTHGRTPAQIVLRWHLQIGTIAIPKSVTPSRIAENFEVMGFRLGPDEIDAIDGLRFDVGRLGPDPETFGA